ncbi:hypothetical protein NEMBOFW57_002337 [Staphylotrichum longicolle]|uniref:Uncharacterized protein n=1 Tax=Staphylotrichum longicolle TaxID=669026 RepID=A0AAD4F358_9PEZI|nr:hypothetical protein NEMBOFW57_002337 [Staphylotrichum longicolle]
MEDQASGRKSKGKGKDAEATPEGTTGHGAAERKEAGTTLHQMAQSAASFLMSGPPTAGLGSGGESSVQLRSTAPAGQTMRLGQTQKHIAQEEASFSAFLDSDSVPMLSEPSVLEDDRAWQSAVSGPTISGGARTIEPASQSVAEQQARDGAEVVALLSSDGDLDHVFEHVNEPPTQEDLAGLRQALFGEGAETGTSAVAWDNVLNFIPEYLQAHAAPGIRPDDELAMHLGGTDAEEGWQAWIGQWSRVLTSYQDEVWGDLGALVDEARTEIRQIKEAAPGEKPPEPTALLRLRAILGHLRGSH